MRLKNITLFEMCTRIIRQYLLVRLAKNNVWEKYLFLSLELVFPPHSDIKWQLYKILPEKNKKKKESERNCLK